ncbi:hypothetical protein QTP81_14990 [Alteromonas sp. ASW11-36]|uniref:MotA/TolQ/ExbB proton channel domain-containing protein n=1 Tax=Alteromonas arenosi TaxID=3055817 RepID=A0ABT7T0E9_9ALTE|nr:hypothetical protein [Alteromonas sp. ASW11-36]MDM7861907.1 hypothetical protein [Alteromonas sp. ASW11-36]
MDLTIILNSTILGVDSITFCIISAIVLIFFLALLAQVNSARVEGKRRKTFRLIAKNLEASDTINVAQQTEPTRLWYANSLQMDGDNEFSATKVGGRFYTILPLATVLCPDPLVNGKGIPALLTSIGVAGTFLGITLGLADFNFDDVGQNSASLVQSAVILLDGMKTAFYTSLAGLAASAVFMIVVQVHARYQVSKTQSLNNRLRNVLAEISPLIYLRKIVEQTDNKGQIESAKAMTEVAGQFSILIERFDRFGESLNGEKMAETIAEAVDKTMRDSVTPVLSEFRDELKSVREFKEDNSQALLNQLVETIKQELIEPVTLELKETSAAVKTSNELSSQLNENVAAVLEQVGHTVETIDKFNSETMQKLQTFAESLRKVLEEFKEDTEGTMSRITAEVNDVLDISVKGMVAQREAFDESATRAAVAFEGMGEKLESALDKRAQSEKTLFVETENRIGQLLEQTSKSFAEQNSVLKQTGDEASRLMESARTELEQGLGDIDTKVTGMSRTVQQELESFREQYQSNLTQFFTQQNNLLEDTLGKQRDNLVEAVEKFKQVFTEEYQTRHNLLQELTTQYEHLQSSAATIQKLAKAIGLTETATMSELQDIANTMGRQVGELKKEYMMAGTAFKEITEGLPKAMEQYFRDANQSTELFFKSFDEAASQIHNRLAQAADFLIDARLQDMSYEKQETA